MRIAGLTSAILNKKLRRNAQNRAVFENKRNSFKIELHKDIFRPDFARIIPQNQFFSEILFYLIQEDFNLYFTCII